MSIGALIVLAPPSGTGARFANRLVRQMLKRPVGPPFNGRLAPGPLKGTLTLVTDDEMDPARQLFRHKLPPGADLRGLFERICRIHVKLLPRDKPLWEQHVFTGLPGHRVALYFKTHHGLIDGIGFLHALNSLISTSRSGSRPQAIWEGLRNVAPRAASSPEPGSLSSVLKAAEDARRTASDMLRLIWHQGLRDIGLGRGLPAPFVTTPDVLKAPPSPHRVMGHCVLPLPQVRSLARQGHAKINDVLLTVLDMAMHRYLAERGTPPDRPLIADIPVALEDDGGAGNRITILQVPMGRPGGTPAERLADIVAETRLVKEEVKSIGADALFMYSIFEHAVASAIESLNLGDLPMLANAVISNPAGVDGKVFFNGLPVELALPVSVVAHHQVLNVTITNYADALHVTFIALREAIPDVQHLADLSSRALAELEKSVGRKGRRPR